MGCSKSKSNRLEDKISSVVAFYDQIMNEIREKRQHYLGKCGDLDETAYHDEHNNNNNINNIEQHEYQKKQSLQTQQSYAAPVQAPVYSQRSTVVFTSKKSLEQEVEKKKGRADVWRFSGRNSLEYQQEKNGLRNSSIIKGEDFQSYMLFLQEIRNKFDNVKSKQNQLIESYYNSDKQDQQVEFKRLHYKIEVAQKKRNEVEKCFNKILNQEQFTSLPDGYYIVNHF